MDRLKKRHEIWIAIAIVLMMINVIFVIISLPILLIVFIDYSICKSKKEIKEEEKIPEETKNPEIIRAVYEDIEERKQKEREYEKSIDVRQFKGRDDVKKEEVEEYLWHHQVGAGRKEIEIIIRKIIKVCNITEEEGKEIIAEHYLKGRGEWENNEEKKIEREYIRRRMREKEKDYKKIDEIIKKVESKIGESEKITREIKEKKKENATYEYIFHYEEWLEKRKKNE